MEQESGEQLKLTDVDSVDDIDKDGEGEFLVIAFAPIREELDEPLRECLAVASQLADTETLDTSERAQLAHQAATGDINYMDHAVSATIRGGNCAWGWGQERSRINDVITAIRDNGDFNYVIVNDFAALGRDINSIRGAVDSILDGADELHIVEAGVAIDSATSDPILDVLDGLDAAGVRVERETRLRDIRDWMDDKPAGGRAPLGYEWVDGELVKAENFDDVRATLSLVRVQDLSKRKAADRLDTSVKTIHRSLDHPDRYGLDPAADPEESPSVE